MIDLRLGDSRFQLEQELGRASGSQVWLARRFGPSGLSRPVVVKEMSRGRDGKPEQARRFLREAALLSQLRHPHVVEVASVGEAHGVHYMVMEYVRGLDLRRVIEQREADKKTVAPGVAATIGVAIADALSVVHDFVAADGVRRRIVHRNISLDNILIGWQGEIKLLDFGSAKDLDLESITASADLLDLALHLPPEALAGDPAAPGWDIYGLGLVLYRLLAGENAFALPPVHSGVADLLDAIGRQAPRPLHRRNRAVPAELAEIVAHAMAKEPQRRYNSAGALQRDLKTWLDAQPKDSSRSPIALLAGFAQPRHTGGHGSGLDDYSMDEWEGEEDHRTVEGKALLAGTSSRRMSRSRRSVYWRNRRRRRRRWVLTGLGGLLLLGTGFGLSRLFAEPPPAVIARPVPETTAPARLVPKGPYGTLAVRCNEWGYVKVDNQAVGTCPSLSVEVAVGQHVVTFEGRRGHREFEVEIVANETAVIDLRQPERPTQVTIPVR